MFPGQSAPYECSDDASVSPLVVGGISVPTLVSAAPELADFTVSNLRSNAVYGPSGRIVATVLSDDVTMRLSPVLLKPLTLAPPYTIDMSGMAQCSSTGPGGPGVLGVSFGIALQNVSGVLRTFLHDTYDYVDSVDAWTDANTFSANLGGETQSTIQFFAHMRITDDGGTRTYYVSMNGLDYAKVFSEASSTFVPTKIGVAFTVSVHVSGIPFVFTITSFKLTSRVLPQITS